MVPCPVGASFHIVPRAFAGLAHFLEFLLGLVTLFARVVDPAREKGEYRKVLWTGEQTQLVSMAIPEGGAIDAEAHDRRDRLLCFHAGSGMAKIGETECEIADEDVSILPSGTFHNFRKARTGRFKPFTSDSPPDHEPGTEYATKAEPEADGSLKIDPVFAEAAAPGSERCECRWLD